MKEKLFAIFFLLFVFGFAFFSLISKEKSISILERRKLTTKEKVKEDFPKNLETYWSDQFPFRDFFLATNQITHRYLLQNKTYQNVYNQKGYFIEQNYPLDQKSIDHFVTGIKEIQEKYFLNHPCFYSILPDKSYFLEEGKGLKLNFNSLVENLKENLNMTYIDSISFFTLEDYYKTDIHIKQPSYFKIIDSLGKTLQFIPTKLTYQKNTFKNFLGSSASKMPFSKKEDLVYLENEVTKKAIVKHLEFDENEVYSKEQLNSIDSYNVFLRGPSSFIEVENTISSSDKELILFRDSFGSSLAPLLLPYYKKITLIDLRYISMEKLSHKMDFNNKDVLFLYSTLLINNSYLLKLK